MSLPQLPVVVIYHPEEEYKYNEISNALKHDFLDISTILTTRPSDTTKSFYWLIFTSNELLTCLKSYTKAVPIGYQLFLRYLSQKKTDIKSLYKFDSLITTQQSIFNNLLICTSGIHNEIKNNIKLITHYLGGIYDGNFTHTTTHLIENTIGSAKHRAAVFSNDKCKIVNSKWIYDCYIYGSIMNEAKYGPNIFASCYISVTGIKSVERETIKRYVLQYGGQYCQGLSQQCTHLIANDSSQIHKDKCQGAIKWNIPILKKEWFSDYLKYKGCIDINKYKYIINKQSQTQIGLNINTEIDIGEDTELRDLMEMIDNHNDNDINMNEENLCYLSECVVLILGLKHSIIKEAIDLVRIAKGTTLRMYHSMGTHVITSDINIIKNKYIQCINHCTIVDINWLRCCYKNKCIIDTKQFDLLTVVNDKKNVNNNNKSFSFNKNNSNANNNNNNNRMDVDNENENETDIFSSQLSITTAITQYNGSNNSRHNNGKEYIRDEGKYYSEFINKCLDMNMNEISNKNVFSGCKFNINKLVLNEQRKINKLISFGGGVIINNILRESEECEYYLICSTISSSEYESIELDANIICVSIIYIYECLKKGILFNRDICISYLPQILRNQQTNSLFDNITICISQFDNHLFERYIIQSLLYDTNATYSKTFHAKRCDILICNHLKGPKYKAANEYNVPIVNFLWLIDSIKNGKQMDYNKYKLLSNNKINKQKRKSSVLGDVFGEELLTAVNNCDENNDLCSPALASIVPPKNNNNNKENIITIDDDVIVLIIQWMILQILVQII